MSKDIPYLNPGDTIGICAPAKAIEKDLVDLSVKFLEDHGFNVLSTPHCTGRHHYFSGTQEERMRDFQKLLDDPSVKAIWCARGGYGSVQIMDLLNWASFIRQPKWIMGFSDITYFHGKLNNMGYPSLHSTMPLNIPENSAEAKSTLIKGLTGESYSIKAEPTKYNRIGEVSSSVVGGNLSIIYALLGTNDQPDFKGKILFIEDLCEHLYAIDRIMHTLRKSGVLESISGLIVGGMTDMKDTVPGFGVTVEELILSHFQYRKLPIAFNFPAGHINDNRSIMFGVNATLSVTPEQVLLSFKTI